MRTVINNLLYDTTKARLIASVEFKRHPLSGAGGILMGQQRTDEDTTIAELGNDVFQCLYKTEKGNYFKFIHSHDRKYDGLNGILNPIDKIGARLWLETHHQIDELLAEFGDEIEEA